MTGRLASVACALALCVTLTLAFAFDALAGKRLGGGQSFGSKPSYNQSYSPSQPGGAQVPPRQSDMRQQASPQQPAPGMPQQRPGGLFGGMGGMLGGLLVGGLLGSMLFGGGFAGPGLMDLVILGGGAWLLFRFLRSRRAQQEVPAHGPSFSPEPEQPMARESAAGWDRLRSEPASSGSSRGFGPTDLPAGFDEAEFLKGAKAAFVRLQDSWNRRDLDDLKSFTSPEVFAQIAVQAKDDPTPSTTDLLMVQAQLLNVVREAEATTATVLFDASIREDPGASQPSQVREVWHFVRDESRPNDMWRLDGIQQVN